MRFLIAPLLRLSTWKMSRHFIHAMFSSINNGIYIIFKKSNFKKLGDCKRNNFKKEIKIKIYFIKL